MWQQEYRRLFGVDGDRGTDGHRRAGAQRHPGGELVAVGIDPGGADALRPYVEEAGATFPVLVDSHGVSSKTFGFRVIPNGILVDRDLVIRYRKDGGFKNENPEDLAAVERFMRGEDPGPSPGRESAYDLGPLQRERVELHMRHGDLLASLGRTDEAVEEWRAALHLDPENLTIRKPIWKALHPEKFHPTIDKDGQREQLRMEREAEVAAGICGPDGCPLPRALSAD